MTALNATPEQMLREFHTAGGDSAGPVPAAPTTDIPERVQELRMKLLDEETDELSEAVIAGDIVEIADALADIVYVAIGTAISYGIPFDAVFREVHRSNMTKFVGGPVTNAAGKIVKGPHFEPADIAGVLAEATAEAQS
jgi:predicted HAD superfamily Cof-like phosphohydrolase